VPVKSIAVLASGGGTNFQAVVDGVADGAIPGRIVCLIFNRKEAFAAERARTAGIPAIYINQTYFPSENEFRQKIFETLLEYRADIVVLAGWLKKLNAATIRHYENRIVNTHPALIPAFCGLGMYGHRVHEAVLAYGAKVSGCTIHLVEENYDTGPIVFQQAVDVLPDDTPDTLAARILPHEHRLLVEAVRLLCEDRLAVEGRQVRVLQSM
jgi:phosphoribosylglycinamide formyltransferase-1